MKIRQAAKVVNRVVNDYAGYRGCTFGRACVRLRQRRRWRQKYCNHLAAALSVAFLARGMSVAELRFFLQARECTRRIESL